MSSRHNKKRRPNVIAESNSQSGSQTDLLNNSVHRNTRTLFLFQILSQILSLIVLAFLYRKVSQEQFGLLGMILPVIGLFRMIPLQSLNIAAVQAESLDRQTTSNLFWATTSLGATATLAGFAATPLLAWFYGAPEIVPISLAISATALVGSLGSQHQSILERNLQVGRVAVIRFIALLVGGLAAVAAAWNGWGVWALVLQQYVELGLVAIGNIAATKFVPLPPRNLVKLKSFVRFGGNFFTANVIFNIGVNLDKFILSFLLGSTSSGRALVGLYTQAFNQMMKPVYLVTTPVAGIMFPALSRAAGDRKLYNSLATDFFRLVALILFPCGVGLFVVAEDAFTILGGEKWRFAGKILCALSLTVVGQGLINICGSLFASTGRTGKLLLSAIAMTTLFAIVFAIAFVVSIQQTENERTLLFAWAYTIGTMAVLLVPYLVWCLSANGVKATTVFRSLLPSAISSALMCLLCVVLHSQLSQLSEVTPLLRFILVVIVGVLAYTLFAISEIRWAAGKYLSRQ